MNNNEEKNNKLIKNGISAIIIFFATLFFLYKGLSEPSSSGMFAGLEEVMSLIIAFFCVPIFYVYCYNFCELYAEIHTNRKYSKVPLIIIRAIGISVLALSAFLFVFSFIYGYIKK